MNSIVGIGFIIFLILGISETIIRIHIGLSKKESILNECNYIAGILLILYIWLEMVK